MKNKVVLISGKQGSGKSTTTDGVVDRLEEKYISSIIIKFAGPLYEMHDAVARIAHRYDIPLSVDKNTGKVKEGKLLQILGTDWIRDTKGKDTWVNIARNRIEKIFLDHIANVVVVDDCRFENEIEVLDSVAGIDVLKVRLEAPEDVRRERCSQWRSDTSHVSETGLDKYAAEGKFDLYFRTDSMDTEQIVEKICNAILNGAY